MSNRQERRQRKKQNRGRYNGENLWKVGDLSELEQRLYVQLTGHTATRRGNPKSQRHGNLEQLRKVTNTSSYAMMVGAINPDGSNVDPYRATAARRFGVPESAVTPEMRAYEKQQAHRRVYSGTVTGRHTRANDPFGTWAFWTERDR